MATASAAARNRRNGMLLIELIFFLEVITEQRKNQARTPATSAKAKPAAVNPCLFTHT